MRNRKTDRTNPRQPKGLLRGYPDVGNNGTVIQLQSLSQFRAVMGQALVRAFCRCCVHTDRLASLLSLAELARAGSSNATASRHILTAIVFGAGTLHELSLALRKLKSCLRKRRLDQRLTHDVHPLDEVLDGIQAHRTAIETLRNKLAYHVDDDLLESGLLYMQRRKEPCTLLSVPARDSPEFTLARDAQIFGLKEAGVEIDTLLPTLGKLHGRAAVAVHTLFLATLIACGISFEGHATRRGPAVHSRDRD